MRGSADRAGGYGGGLFAGTAWHYARYRPGYPRRFLDDVIRRSGLDGTGRLLDLGCGTGQLTLPLAPHVAEAVGVDAEPEMLGEAIRQAQVQCVPNVTWVEGNSADLPGELGRFKLVTMGRSFHWMDREQVVAALDCMVEAGGSLVIANDRTELRTAAHGSTAGRCGRGHLFKTNAVVLQQRRGLIVLTEEFSCLDLCGYRAAGVVSPGSPVPSHSAFLSAAPGSWRQGMPRPLKSR